MKLGMVTDRRGTPLAVATDSASVPEVVLGPAVLAGIPAGVWVPWGTPVLADRGYDSDPLRDDLAGEGFELLSPHRKGRKRPPVNDGRRMRRYRRRYVIERTFAWVKSFRRVATRFEYHVALFDGFVSLACALIALSRL
jgi:transposase